MGEARLSWSLKDLLGTKDGLELMLAFSFDDGDAEASTLHHRA
jgi:hypothetical protein